MAVHGAGVAGQHQDRGLALFHEGGAVDDGPGAEEGTVRFTSKYSDDQNEISDAGDVEVPLKRLDQIMPLAAVTLLKIDVEGFEAEVLAGLSNPVRALSFEFTTIQRDVGFACIGRCAALGYTKFNGALGETQKLAHESWVDSRSISDWLGALPHEANSGDIYARLD